MITDRTFVLDMDGTICRIKERDESYTDVVQREDVVAKSRN